MLCVTNQCKCAGLCTNSNRSWNNAPQYLDMKSSTVITHICHANTFNTAVTMVERKSNIRITKDTHTSPSRTTYGESCEDVEEKWPRYNGIALYYAIYMYIRVFQSEVCRARYCGINPSNLNHTLKLGSCWKFTNMYAYCHYGDVIMSVIASQITSLAIVYSTIYSGADQRNHQTSASLAFVRGIHRGPVNSPHKWPVTRKMFPFDDVMMAVFDYSYDICQYVW